MTRTVPPLRRPLEPEGRAAWVRHWYENELGWPTVPGWPLRLVVGTCFDVLDVPAEAGQAALRHLGTLGRPFPVAAQSGRMRLLVAAGSAEELPGLLEWLEWGAVGLDLVGLGAGCVMDAPMPAVLSGSGGGSGGGSVAGSGAVVGRTDDEGPEGWQGAAVWVRPPEPGCDVESSLPTLSAMGGRADTPDLTRVLNTVATQCHRVRLRRACAEPRVVPAL